jgi:hypothetical protein
VAHNNPAHARAYSRAYYAAHRVERLAYAAARYAAHREKVIAASHKYRATHLETRRAYDKTYGAAHRKEKRANNDANRYGVPDGWREEMHDAQEGGCAICEKPIDVFKAHIDHDHNMGITRALLCGPCNTRLGTVENADWLERAQSYLESHRQAGI